MAVDRTRTYSWEDPLALHDQMAGRSGLELMQTMVSGELPPPPIAETLGFRLVEASRGRAVFECEPAEFHYNPIGIVHAGLAMTLMDSAMGLAFVTTIEGWCRLDDPRIEGELHAGADRGDRCRSLRRLGRASRPQGVDDRGADRGRPRSSLRPWDEHDPGASLNTMRRDANGFSLSPVATRRVRT